MAGKRRQRTKEQVIASLGDNSRLFHNRSGLTELSYFDICYDYAMENIIDRSGSEWRIRNVDTNKRSSSYYTGTHTGKTDGKKTRREEEWFVLDAFNGRVVNFDAAIGRILDYQVPLKNTSADKGYKAIDFITAGNDGAPYLELCEIKADDSDESILKAIFELQTYYQLIDHRKLLNDYREKLKADFGIELDAAEPEKSCRIKKTVIVFENTPAAAQFTYGSREFVRIKELIDGFGMDIKVLHQMRVVKVTDAKLNEIAVGKFRFVKNGGIEFIATYIDISARGAEETLARVCDDYIKSGCADDGSEGIVTFDTEHMRHVVHCAADIDEASLCKIADKFNMKLYILK